MLVKNMELHKFQIQQVRRSWVWLVEGGRQAGAGRWGVLAVC